MTELKYAIEDRVIAQLLGQQNFTNDESAVLELIKNAYDAKATLLDIYFANSSITFVDNGCGMDKDDILNYWMCVGKSHKGYSTSSGQEVRILAGSKGIGRFALARLGDEVELHSKKVEAEPVCWYTDWNHSVFLDKASTTSNGTRIVIRNLRDRWDSYKVKRLYDFLSRTCIDSAMEIVIHHCGERQSVRPYLPEPKLGINCLSVIRLSYDSANASLSVTVESDEFLDEARRYCPFTNLNYFKSTLNIYEEFEDSFKEPPSSIDLRNSLRKIGDFTAQFCFAIFPTKKEIEKFLYKHRLDVNHFKPGVILYRNAFSISSMEGKKDWLGLGKRSRKSPAAATHPTGNWRVRENQLSGKVEIDKQRNEVLQDLSNRQGLDENIYYDYFVQIVLLGITEFERYRQSIIRQINTKNIRPKVSSQTHISQVIANPSYVLSLSAKESVELATELKSVINENHYLTNNQKEIEGQYRYDVRILNVLATMGLKAFSAAHEFKNIRTNLVRNIENIIQALKRYQMWETLSSEENTRISSRNVPKLLEENRVFNQKVAVFMNAVLTNIEKRKFYKVKLNIFQTIDRICENWKRDYSFVNFKLDIAPDLEFELSEDVLYVIFDNLILNSIQQNDRNNALAIQIRITSNSQMLFCQYFDDGVGLANKYLSSPRRILEVHETNRDDGHGLGMWILNNTCISTGGEVSSIEGKGYFRIEFTIGDKLP